MVQVKFEGQDWGVFHWIFLALGVVVICATNFPESLDKAVGFTFSGGSGHGITGHEDWEKEPGIVNNVNQD